jgi:NAD(P)-dependent dehydrogenase (short-subunit alcohol dehydrogenase family)
VVVGAARGAGVTGPAALVTGAGRGAGRALALALGATGGRVAAVDVNPDAAQRTADLIGEAGGEARAETVDVANKMAVQTLLYALLEDWGRLDIVVNAARVVPGSPALKLDEWEWNRTLDVNLKGAFLVAQTAARAMAATGGGAIFNVIRADEDAAHAGVAAARAGLVALTAALAREWAALGVEVRAVEAGAEGEAVVREYCRRWAGDG